MEVEWPIWQKWTSAVRRIAHEATVDMRDQVLHMKANLQAVGMLARLNGSSDSILAASEEERPNDFSGSEVAATGHVRPNDSQECGMAANGDVKPN